MSSYIDSDIGHILYQIILDQEVVRISRKGEALSISRHNIVKVVAADIHGSEPVFSATVDENGVRFPYGSGYLGISFGIVGPPNIENLIVDDVDAITFAHDTNGIRVLKEFFPDDEVDDANGI
jgi:hypothetical protein